MIHPRDEREPCPECRVRFKCDKHKRGCIDPEKCPCRTVVCELCKARMAGWRRRRQQRESR